MAKVSYVALQKKYAGKIVALTNKEDEVVAASKNLSTLFKKIQQAGYDKKILSLLARWKNTVRLASIKFPYHHKIIDFDRIPDSLVKLQIKTKDGFYLTLKFLVDSGADATTLPLVPYGKLVGFKPNKEEKVTIGGVV